MSSTNSSDRLALLSYATFNDHIPIHDRGGRYGKISYHDFITILCYVGFTIFSEQCSQNNFPIIKTKPFMVTKYKKMNGGYLGQNGWR